MSNEKITISKDCPTCEKMDKYVKDVGAVSSQRGNEIWQEYNNLSKRINELKQVCPQCNGTGRIKVSFSFETLLEYVKEMPPKHRTNKWAELRDPTEIVTKFNPYNATLNHMAAVIDVFIGDIGDLKRRVEELENVRTS